MALFQIILLVILGIIVLVGWLLAGHHYIAAGIIVAIIVGIGYLILKLFAGAVETGLRGKYPLDYLMNIGWVVKKFQEAGFERGEYINPGTDYPGIYMEKDNVKVAIMLNANEHPFKIECIDANGVKLFSVDEQPAAASEQIVDDVMKLM